MLYQLDQQFNNYSHIIVLVLPKTLIRTERATRTNIRHHEEGEHVHADGEPAAEDWLRGQAARPEGTGGIRDAQPDVAVRE